MAAAPGAADDDDDAEPELTEEDLEAMRQLKAIADGSSGLTGREVRTAAADLLLASGADWPRLRLLLVAAEKGGACPAAALTTDLARVVMQWYFLLGGG